ncbi:serine hydrolase domain-containing protein [Dermacoccaceae bacterium W4C1]
MTLPEATRAHLDARLAQEQSEQRLPSLTAALLRDGDLVWSGAAGTTDGRSGGELACDTTQYRIGSITKSAVAVAVLRLVAEGEVALEDRIRTHLPDLSSDLDQVRILDLLSHTAGLAAETEGPWWERSPGQSWTALLPSVRRVHLPGRRFHYSNVGYAVLGKLLENVRQRSWDAVVTDEVLTPLRMNATSYHPSSSAAPGWAVHPDADLVHHEPLQDTLAMAPAGQLWSTATDLARWAGFLIEGDERVLPHELLREALTPGPVADSGHGAWTRCYGLGFDITQARGRRLVGHGGSMPGFQAAVRADREGRVGVAVLTNSTAGPGAGLTDDLLDLLTALAPASPKPWHTDTSAAAHADLVGTWYWGPRPYVLATRGDGALTLGPAGGGARWSLFTPTTDGAWIGQDDYWAGERLRVHRDTEQTYLDLGSFRLSRLPYAPEADIPGGVDPSGWHA